VCAQVREPGTLDGISDVINDVMGIVNSGWSEGDGSIRRWSIDQKVIDQKKGDCSEGDGERNEFGGLFFFYEVDGLPGPGMSCLLFTTCLL